MPTINYDLLLALQKLLKQYSAVEIRSTLDVVEVMQSSADAQDDTVVIAGVCD